jgi:organic radical activating enzyme
MMSNKIKIRVFPEHNYKAIHFNGKTIRIAINSKRPIDKLRYPEFYDIKVTSYCEGNCPWCYQNSSAVYSHDRNIVDKFVSFFGQLTDNQKPFQLAFGGGEPVSHPDFIKLIITCYEMGITPNYTTNGMWVDSGKDYINKVLQVTSEYCGGVAVSTHSHLKWQWKLASELYLSKNIFTNLHIIVGDKNSIDDFVDIYNEYRGRIKYFVLLPLIEQGRSKKSFSEWDYLKSRIRRDSPDIAFGANFYPYLVKDLNSLDKFNINIYIPEIVSAYLDLEIMKIYPSSFSTECVKQIK